jgi:uncharacterized protein
MLEGLLAKVSMSFDSLAHLFAPDSPDYTLVPTLLFLGAAALALCFLFPCLPDGLGSKPDEPYYGTDTGSVTSLHVYPVKSCAGHSVDRWKIGRTGLEFDRQWVVVGKEGRFRSQRRLPKMALLKPSLPTSAKEPLTLTMPGCEPLQVPVIRARDANARLLDVGVWDDKCIGVDQGDAAAAWLTEALGEAGLRLLRMDESYNRPTDPDFGKGFVTAFSDGYPALLASEESLQDLNSKLQQPIGMERFRPNIVVSGLGAWSEDLWTKVCINDKVFRVVKPCARCQIPTIDQVSCVCCAASRRQCFEYVAH